MQGYRTIIFNGIMILFTIVGYLAPGTVLPSQETVGQHLDAIIAGFMFFWGVGNLALRLITKTPAGKKE